jgi:two-component system phosphate regulon response regulator PhoB
MRELVLVVEDEEELRSTVEYNLSRAGYRTASTAYGREACQIAATAAPGVVILDLNLPDISGFEVCRALRSEPLTRAIPILVLSARDGEVDRVVALEIGADDYVSKPFSVRELMLRIDGLIRRSGPPADEAGDETMAAGPLQLDRGRRRCLVEDSEIHLSSTEFELLRTLMERPGRVQTRERLLADVWHSPGDISGRTVDTHVKRLRQKLRRAGELIRTVRGVGYCFDHRI